MANGADDEFAYKMEEPASPRLDAAAPAGGVEGVRAGARSGRGVFRGNRGSDGEGKHGFDIPVASVSAAPRSQRGDTTTVRAPLVQAPRQPTRGEPAPKVESAERWSCAHCTYAENEHLAVLCQMCGRSKRARLRQVAMAGSVASGASEPGAIPTARGDGRRDLKQASSRPNLEEKVHIREVLKIKGRFSASNIARVDKLSQQYGAFRGARGDGNCYYRSVLVSALSTIFSSWTGSGNTTVGDGKTLLENLRRRMEAVDFAILASEPDQELAYEEARRVTLSFIDNLASVADGDRSIAGVEHDGDKWAGFDMPPYQRAINYLVSMIQGDHVLDMALIKTLRGMASAYIREFATDVDRGPCGLTYQDYIPTMEALSNGQPLDGFCRDVVEELGTDAQDILLQVVAEALGISVRVEFFFTDQEQTFYARGLDKNCPPLATVLLHPGHFDIIYRWEYCSWVCGKCKFPSNKSTRRPGLLEKCVKCDAVHPDAPRFAVGDRVMAVPDERYPRRIRVGIIQQFPDQMQSVTESVGAGEEKDEKRLAWPSLYGEYLVQFEPDQGVSFFSGRRPTGPVKVRKQFIWREGEKPKHLVQDSVQSSRALASAIPVARVVGKSSNTHATSRTEAAKMETPDNKVEVGDRVKCFYLDPGRWYSGTCTKLGFHRKSQKEYIEVAFDDEDRAKFHVDKVFKYANPLPHDGLLFTEGDEVIVTTRDHGSRPGLITSIVRMNISANGRMRGMKKSTGVYSVRVFEPGSQKLVYDDIAELDEKHISRARENKWTRAGRQSSSSIANRVQSRQRGWNTRIW